MNLGEMITVAEAAKRLQRSQQTVEAMIRDGSLWFAIWYQGNKGEKDKYLVPREAFERFLRGELQPPKVQLEALRMAERFLMMGGKVS